MKNSEQTEVFVHCTLKIIFFFKRFRHLQNIFIRKHSFHM